MDITQAQFLARIKERCEQSFEFFARYFFKVMKGQKFVVADHHRVLFDTLEKVHRGELTHVIINMPPRYGKTEVVVKLFSAWCYALNPACEFIHLSYSEELALDNSGAIKSVIQTKEFQQLWPTPLSKAADGAWKTEAGGSFFARSAGGQVTGYGAGKLNDFQGENGFGGCFPYEQLIVTDVGLLPIGEVVERNLRVRVRAYDEGTQRFVWRPIERYWHNPANEILEVRLSNGDVFRCTPNHKILTRDGWKTADSLRNTDVLVNLPDVFDRMDGNSKPLRGFFSREGSVGCDGNFFGCVSGSEIPDWVGEVFGDTPPCFSRFNLADNAASNAVTLINNLGRFWADENFSNLFSSKFGSRATLKHRESSVPQRVPHVLCFGAVSEVDESVVKMVPVQMAALDTFFSWADERLKNKLVNISQADLALDRKSYANIAVPIWHRIQNLSFDKVWGADLRMVIGGDRAVDATNPSEVADLVKADVVRDIRPVLIKKVGHVSKTYCLQVRGNHNFTVGESGVVVSNCILIDDPVKPTDANSDPLRNAINNRWDAVIKSRFNSPKTPCIVIMQRIHEDDFCGMLMRDTEYKFTQVLLPAIIDEGTDHERALWPEKHSLERLHAMKAKNSYVFSSQMQQRPSPLGGGIIQTKWFGYYDIVPRLKYRAIFVDTAQKEKEHNDFQVASLWGLGEDGYLYLLDMLHARFQAYELEERIPAFWVKAKSDKSSPLRYMGVEDKASGTQLIQTLSHKVKPKIPVKAIQRSRSKLERVMDVQGYIESGYVKLPRNTAWLADFLSECEAFTADDTHAHDDQIDTMCDAISNMLIHSTTLYSDAF